MQIVVCVKAVSESFIQHQSDGAHDHKVINPYDLYALQKVLSCPKVSEHHVTCICVGPESAKAVLTRCLAMGADEAVLLSDQAFAGSDTYATSFILSEAIARMKGCHMVVCGQRAVDGETGQVVYSLAKRLGFVCADGVISLQSLEDDGVIVDCEVNDYIETRHYGFPILLSFRDFSLDEGDISLFALKRAKNMKITLWDAKELQLDEMSCGLKGSKTRVICAETILSGRDIQMLDGSQAEQANTLQRIIAKRICEGK